jgi:probable HAF family extracellular repeat protein
VGYASITGSPARHAFLYSGGTMFDLNALVTVGLGSVSLYEATGINNNGQIVANGSGLTGCQTYRLDPIARPDTDVPTLSRTALAATALLLLAGGWLGLRGVSKGS